MNEYPTEKELQQKPEPECDKCYGTGIQGTIVSPSRCTCAAGQKLKEGG